ncbi:hypothetical protein [Mesorhizobium caraganae]|uniref:hypothetical protein n=1 Tax=Mesorhizobium caraganae TaxID=483206 RepID=UPI00333AFD01
MTTDEQALTWTTAATAKFVRVKFLDTEQRIIEGTASTPVTDRQGDIVEPLGATWQLPIPLLLDHRTDQAVGEVFEANATAKGIRFKARITKIEQPGAAQDLVNYAWDLIKSGLRKTVSIGFRGIEAEHIPGGGIRFKTWSWLELSMVSIPSNPHALIESIKGLPAGPPATFSPIVVSTDIEIQRIRARVREIDLALKGIKSDEYYRFKDLDFVNSANAAKSKLATERRQLVEREVEVKAGLIDLANEATAEQTKTAATAKPQQHHAAPAWEIRNLPEPRLSGLNVDQVLDSHSDLFDHYADVVAKMMSEIGLAPTALVTHQEQAVTDAASMSCVVQLRAIARLLDKRMTDLEQNATVFRGVFQRSLPYRKGSLVIHGGSLWCALRSVEEGIVPDGSSSDDWQLCVKKGEFG